MATQTTYLITGANRGIGLALAAILLLRPKTTVIGTLRSASTSSAALRALPTAASARLLLKTLDFASATPATYTTLAVELAVVGVRQIDVVVANAGIGRDFASAFSTLATSVRAHLDVNTLGPMQLYQALRGMLVAPAEAEGEGEGGNVKKFVLMSSSLGSIGAMEGAVPSLAYGISKAAANYFVRKVHFEERDLVALAIHPGWVKTENGQCFADSVNVDAPPMEVEESARGVMEQIDKATRETTSGSFVAYDGTIIPW